MDYFIKEMLNKINNSQEDFQRIKIRMKETFQCLLFNLLLLMFLQFSDGYCVSSPELMTFQAEGIQKLQRDI